MAQVTSYDGRSAAGVLNSATREDLLSIITNIDPTESQLLSGLGDSVAKDRLHQWLTDTLATPASLKVSEGSDPTYASRTNPARVTNQIETVRAEYAVSDTERAITHAGFDDRFAYEKMKAMKEWRNAAEFDLMRSTLVCGPSGTAAQLKGVKSFITTNATVTTGVSGGQSLTETILNDYFQNAWNSGGNPDEIYVGARLKRRISGFTAGLTKNIAAEDKRLVAAVDVYESDFGLVKIFKHRYVTQSGDNGFDLVGLQNDMWKIAYLRKPVDVEVGKTGSSTKGYIEGDLTLEARNEKSSFFAGQLQ